MEICAVAHHLTSLRTLFTEYGKGIAVTVAKEMDLIATLSDAGLLAKMTTLDLRAPASKGLLNVDRTSAIIPLFSALEDLSITHFTRTSMTMQSLYNAPSHQPVVDALEKLPHLRILSLQGLVLPSGHNLPSHLPALQHIDLLSSFISLSVAVTLTSLVRDSLKTLHIGIWDLDPPSFPIKSSTLDLGNFAPAPLFDLPQLSSITLRFNEWITILRAFASSPLREVHLRAIGPMDALLPSTESVKDVLLLFKSTLKKVSGPALEDVRDWGVEHGIEAVRTQDASCCSRHRGG